VQIDRVFEPFERLGAETSGIPGTGLGLALSRMLMELMQGSIRVESEPGLGSTFTVSLQSGSRGERE
jgi:signal transduction histidine kinase